jgi:hypothetical protein
MLIDKSETRKENRSCACGFSFYGKGEYARLASISVAHLYNLRRHPRYRQRLLPTTKTRPTQASIGERRKPTP